MINLDLRSPLHWSTAWARRVGARVAVLVDLIAAHCHEALGVSSTTIADAINKQIVDPLVRDNFPPRTPQSSMSPEVRELVRGAMRKQFASAGTRFKTRRLRRKARAPLRAVLRCRGRGSHREIGIQTQTVDRLLRDAVVRAHLPKWWRSFAGYDRWCHDGTCGFAVDRAWMFKHWSASVVIEIALFKVSASIEAFTAAIDKLVKQINSMSAIVLPRGLEFIPSAERVGPRAELGLPPFVMQPRSHGKRAAMRAVVDCAKAEGHEVLIIDDVAPIPAEPSPAALLEAHRAAQERDFPGFAARYFDTGHMKRSVRMGENAGINALTGALTVWIPEPQEADVTQEPLRELNVPEGADLELSGAVWGPSPTREFFMQMRARRRKRPVRTNWRVVVAVPIADVQDGDRDEATLDIARAWASDIGIDVPEDTAIKILCDDEDGNIVSYPLTAEAGEPASGDEVEKDEAPAE